jgi:beta-phosphoglucomutase
MQRAVLWDLDGTILDSRDLHWEAWRVFAEQQGRPMTHDFFDRTFGLRNEVVLRRHFGAELADAEIERMNVAKEAVYHDLARSGALKALPGVYEWLRWAKANGWRQALATMAPQINIGLALEALDLRSTFDAIVSGEEVRHGKPDPEVFLLAAERVGVPPARCVVIEDSPLGVEAAHRAGMCCIGVGLLHQSLQADVTLPTLADAGPQMLRDLK